MFLRHVAKDDYLFLESVRRRAEEMRRELAGAFPTPLELLAVERVVAAWLQVQHVESQIVLADGEIHRAKFWLQRQLQASRVYHAAVKSLLLVRELLPPATEPSSLASNGTGDSTANHNGQLRPNGKAGSPSRQPEPRATVNRINGTMKNGKSRGLVTV
jgi:hypothetical protein